MTDKIDRRGNPAWQKGVSGNPGGRPSPDKARSLAARIRELTREGEDLAYVLLDAMNAQGDFEDIKPRDRLRAVELLLERGFGKALDRVVVADGGKIPQAVEELSVERLTDMARALRERVRQRNMASMTLDADYIEVGDDESDEMGE